MSDTSVSKTPETLLEASQISASESPEETSESQSIAANDPNLEMSEGDSGTSDRILGFGKRTLLPGSCLNEESAAPEVLAEFFIAPSTPGSTYAVPQTLPHQHQQEEVIVDIQGEVGTASETCTNVDALETTTLNPDTAAAVGLKSPSNLSVDNHGAIDTWLDGGVADDSGVNFEWEYGDSPSGPSSYAASIASIFSVASLASSASDMSRGSGYSAVQIATATKVLLAIFYEDETLLSLYKSAIENQAIGPARLQRNLRRLFRAYAGLLEGEATERLEYLASRLVLIKSAMLAQSIVEKLQNGRAALPLSRKERNEESSDEEEDVADVRTVNEDAFEDLAIFREFLVESEAFKTYRLQLQAFIVPKSTHLTHLESARSEDIANAAITEAIAGQEMTSTWQDWRNDSKKSTGGFFGGAYGKITASSVLLRMTDAFMSATDDVMIAAGLLEPLLRPDTVRLRWQCVLQQERIEDVTTDRALLCFLRKQYLRHRGRFLHILSLKSVKGISFVKFRLPIGGTLRLRYPQYHVAVSPEIEVGVDGLKQRVAQSLCHLLLERSGGLENLEVEVPQYSVAVSPEIEAGMDALKEDGLGRLGVFFA
ncbi:uncharacterized protein J4E79_000742 [Alternaria viburni]|uniref:uncharacterized protein n=1 Tax=Alternaria viburni TaxID=566460 RepID=UPI0020C36243|nr:uncharacterized protein J4E79_000742 [Alternaria viburni]KAI4670460.1 hypothetical protein J4E79_000742 [Alternaria viburni]